MLCYRTTVLIFNTCDGVADYMRVAAKHGGRFVFFTNRTIYGVVPLGYPPKHLKKAKNVDFGYTPKNRVFGVQNASLDG
jgi:hypothetical protein